MAFEVYIEGVQVTSGDVVTLPDTNLASLAPFEIEFRNTGGGALTVVTVTEANWGRNFAISSDVIGEISGGQSAVGELTITGFGPLAPSAVAGSYWQRFDIAYNDGTDKTFTFLVKARVRSTRTRLVISYEDFLNRYLIDVWSLSANQETELNPLKFNHGIAEEGHYTGWYQQHVLPNVEAGIRQLFNWMPFGATASAQGLSDLQFDHYLVQQELYPDKSLWRDGWAYARDAFLASHANAQWYTYTGTMRESETFLGYISAGNPRSFLTRFFRSVEPYISKPNCHLCLDVPHNRTAQAGNPLIQPGEMRFEAMKMLREAMQGRVYCEPRGPATQTHWHGGQGWHRILQERIYWRANPAYYADAGDVMTDAQMAPGDIVRWQVNTNPDVMAYQIASILDAGHIVGIPVRTWVAAGRTLPQLHAQVQTTLDIIRGYTAGSINDVQSDAGESDDTAGSDSEVGENEVGEGGEGEGEGEGGAE